MENFLIRELDFCLMRMPSWLDTKDYEQYALWKKIYKCNRILKRLLVNNVLNKFEIDDLAFDFDINYKKITDRNYEFDIAVYYAGLFNEIMEIVLIEEEYAIAANIKNIIDRYFKNIIFDL